MSMKKLLMLLCAVVLWSQPVVAEEKNPAQPQPEKSLQQVEAPAQAASDKTPDTSKMLFVQNMRKAGATIYYLGEALGLHGWFAMKDNQVQIFYTTPDQRALIVGALLSAEGANISQQQVMALANSKPEIERALKAQGANPAAAASAPPAQDNSTEKAGGAENFYAELLKGATVTVGAPSAPQLVMIMDVHCQHCHKTWAALSPLVEQGKLRVTLFPISALGEKSQAEGAVWLAQKDPADAWKKYMAGDKKIFTSAAPDPARMKAMADNTLLIQKWKVDYTPYLLYRGKQGKIRLIVGEPKSVDLIMNDIGHGGGG